MKIDLVNFPPNFEGELDAVLPVKIKFKDGVAEVTLRDRITAFRETRGEETVLYLRAGETESAA